MGAKKQPTKRGATELFSTNTTTMSTSTTTGQQSSLSLFSTTAQMAGTSKRPRLDQVVGPSTAMTPFDVAMQSQQQRQHLLGNNIQTEGIGKPMKTNNIKPKSMSNGPSSQHRAGTVPLPREPPNEALLQTQREISHCIRQFTPSVSIFLGILFHFLTIFK